ncbi:MAG: carboxypeptidase M32 [Candidatus Glassbacteria bacterium]|nr:carboxypeptidase M32 [Candidatus Glassbacteria bacterium]
MGTVNGSYKRLIKLVRETGILHSVAELLEWDQEVCMPAGGNAHRAEQMALLAGMVHEKITAPEIGELLAECEQAGFPAGGREEANVREIGRRYRKKTCLPVELVRELARVTANAHPVWVQARSSRDFSLFRPHLERIVALKREQAAAVGYESSPYDPLLDDYEPGETAGHLAGLFDGLAPALASLLSGIREAPRKPDSTLVRRRYPAEAQRKLGIEVSRAIGFDYERGRVDTVVHPFCLTVGPGDVRITTRYNERFFNEAFFGFMHETGHGLYEQGLVAEDFGLPAGESVSLGIHESQSRLWENAIGRGKPFWKFFFPRLAAAFPDALAGVSLDDWLLAINEVKPSFIRVEADEITYNLHIILRFQIERALIEGDLDVADLPDAWNGKFSEMFGLEVPDDSQGVLQDVHWSAGLFGYFPTYCLGNICAAQFFAAAREQIPGLESGLEAGEFAPLLEWLREKIHRRGMLLMPRELVRDVTGKELSVDCLLSYLAEKFGNLYGI